MLIKHNFKKGVCKDALFLRLPGGIALEIYY